MKKMKEKTIQSQCPCLDPQIHMSQSGGAELTHRCRRSSSPAAQASPLEDEDLLWEILLRLPPQPSSLPRASAVSKLWRSIVDDPKFHRQFCAHHRKPPLLGAFSSTDHAIVFNPILDPPDCIPPVRMSLGRCSNRDDCGILNCRNGLVLVHDWLREEAVVCDPVNGKQRRVAIPPDLRDVLGGAVLCATTDLGHVHGGCHSSPFKVVLVSAGSESDSGDLACVYSSETGAWGNLISTAAPCELSDARATLVGTALYWLFEGDQILEFDLDGLSLAPITGPPLTNDFLYGNHHIIQGEDGAVGFATLSRPRLQTWQRKVNCHGVATWVPWKTIEMHTILGLPSPIEGQCGWLLGYDEDNGVIFLHVAAGVYTVQLMSMQSRKLYETHNITGYHPFRSFYAPGTDISGSRYIG